MTLSKLMHDIPVSPQPRAKNRVTSASPTCVERWSGCFTAIDLQRHSLHDDITCLSETSRCSSACLRCSPLIYDASLLEYNMNEAVLVVVMVLVKAASSAPLVQPHPAL